MSSGSSRSSSSRSCSITRAPRLHGDDYRVRALLRFAGEEAKHIHLFKRFGEEFARGFGTPLRRHRAAAGDRRAPS